MYETWGCTRSFSHAQSFLDRFVFFWGCEQCSKMFGEISHVSHYYLKDLKCVYYVCHGKDYGKEDQTLLINNEPNKVLWNSKWTGLFLESLGDKCCQIIRCNGWTYHFICGHPWLDCIGQNNSSSLWLLSLV